MQVIETPGVPVKMWIDGVEAEAEATKQLTEVAQMPFVFRHIAVMPDVHAGKGSTVGCVIPTIGAVMPATVGVDIGCGMIALKTALTIDDLPQRMWSDIRCEIEERVPCGRTNNGREGDVGAWPYRKEPKVVSDTWRNGLAEEYTAICEENDAVGGYGVKAQNTVNQLGTLGTGNHFIEVSTDENGTVWMVLHSGSRGPGNRIGTYFTKLAQHLCDQWYVKLPNPDLAYLPVRTDEFQRYRVAVQWAQTYAYVNRALMMGAVREAVTKVVGREFPVSTGVNCHHNYISWEKHFGKDGVMVTRKGAVRAEAGDLGFIPGSMGARSYVVEGLGNRESFNSCSHGAGRRMSRTKAKATFTLEDHAAATAGVECRKDAGVLDETPGAYKDIDAVMAAQSDLVKPLYVLKQFLCVKG